ncbi:PASTA domain-containing protein [Pseudonocardia xinjiangensis]|uniref:PASTA domain-containing protein n=1 Tax=Pseudonocardia xinjiangensis TaxID=75289 RepID=UPI003D8A12A1
MVGGRDPWPDGRDAWGRLDGWDHGGRDAEGAAAGDAALDALSDIGVVRRLLDQTELAAVKAARSNGKSWAEIATMLGMTRQSAWERWRDLDGDERAATRRGGPAAGDEPESGRPRAVHERLGEAARGMVGAMRASAVVPDVLGLSWVAARRALELVHLVAVSSDSDLLPLLDGELSGYVVVEQKPVAGTRVPPRSPVTLWVERGPGSAGVRSPLRPPPPPRAISGAIDETTGESVR